MKVILLDETEQRFNQWIKENFGSEQSYKESIALFEANDFFNAKDGFLGFRFSVKKYLSWLADKFNVKESSVDMKKQILTYSDKAKKLIIEFSYQFVNQKYNNFIVTIKDLYSSSTYSLTYENFKKLINDSIQMIASILAEKFPNKFNIKFDLDRYGNSSVRVPEMF